MEKNLLATAMLILTCVFGQKISARTTAPSFSVRCDGRVQAVGNSGGTGAVEIRAINQTPHLRVDAVWDLSVVWTNDSSVLASATEICGVAIPADATCRIKQSGGENFNMHFNLTCVSPDAQRDTTGFYHKVAEARFNLDPLDLKGSAMAHGFFYCRQNGSVHIELSQCHVTTGSTATTVEL